MKLNINFEIEDETLVSAMQIANERERDYEPLNTQDIINYIFDNRRKLTEEERSMIIDLLGGGSDDVKTYP